MRALRGAREGDSPSTIPPKECGFIGCSRFEDNDQAVAFMRRVRICVALPIPRRADAGWRLFRFPFIEVETETRLRR